MRRLLSNVENATRHIASRNPQCDRFVTLVIFRLPFGALIVDVVDITKVSESPPCPDPPSTLAFGLRFLKVGRTTGDKRNKEET
jgi:hypothetical protein